MHAWCNCMSSAETLTLKKFKKCVKLYEKWVSWMSEGLAGGWGGGVGAGSTAMISWPQDSKMLPWMAIPANQT